MTDVPIPETDLGRLAESLDRLSDRLDIATDAMRRTRRHLWLTIAAVVVVVGLAGVGAADWIADRRDRDRIACERRNAISEGVITAAGTAVETAARELAGDDTDARSEARRIAAVTVTAVAEDEALQPREC